MRENGERRRPVKEEYGLIFDGSPTNGILIEFIDGVTCRVFPRILTYSADYPEKCIHYIDVLLG